MQVWKSHRAIGLPGAPFHSQHLIMDKVTIRPVGKSAASSAATVSLIFTITTALKEDSDETDCDLIYDACEAKRPDIKGPAVGFMNALFCPEDQQQIKSLGFPVLAATIDGKPVGLGSLMPYHITLNPSLYEIHCFAPQNDI